MADKQMAMAATHWHEQIAAHQAELDMLRPQLIDAESQLAEVLSELNAFAFLVRSKLDRLSQRLAHLEADTAELRQQLRARQYGWETNTDFDEREAARGWEFAGDDAEEPGDFRYRRQPADQKPPSLSADDQAELRHLYRQLARRFHPDLALDEDDRARRTEIMMAINSAHTTGNLERMRKLALEPDTSPHTMTNDAELAESLAREVAHCRRRLAEIVAELAALDGRTSSRLLARSKRAAAEGRDLLEELAADLRQRISEKMVERDVLQVRLDELEFEEPGSDSLAEILYDLGLEEAGEDGFLGDFSGQHTARDQEWTNEWSEDDVEDILDDID